MHPPHRVPPPQSSSSWAGRWKPVAWRGVWIGPSACQQEDRWTTDCSSDWTDTLPTGMDWSRNALPTCRPFWFPVWNKHSRLRIITCYWRTLSSKRLLGPRKKLSVHIIRTTWLIKPIRPAVLDKMGHPFCQNLTLLVLLIHFEAGWPKINSVQGQTVLWLSSRIHQYVATPPCHESRFLWVPKEVKP